MDEQGNTRRLHIQSVDKAAVTKLGGIVGCLGGLLVGLGWLAYYGSTLPAAQRFEGLALLVPIFGSAIAGFYGLILGAIAGWLFNGFGGLIVQVADVADA